MKSDSIKAEPPAERQHNDVHSHPSVNRIPRATYRFQLRKDFGFDQLKELMPYIDALGISDLYLSPLFQSREESVHGYDVVDHGRVEPSFGNEKAFRRLASTARDGSLGILLDIVPNHMGINDPGNAAWNDVLENGRIARSAAYFDIDWNPAGGGLSNQILLPFLGKPFGETLEAGELKIVYEKERFLLSYYDRCFPINPLSWTIILQLAIEAVLAEPLCDESIELQSIHTQLRNLAAGDRNDPLATEERYREQTIARERLSSLCKHSAGIKIAVDKALHRINGGSVGPDQWNLLEDLIDKQHYRLAFWRVAADEINYRRFFDINDLAAICVENEAVFRSVHDLAFRWISEGLVTGIRIDHPDGLLDPKEYFQNLQDAYSRRRTSEFASGQSSDTSALDRASLYIVVEKILSGEEKLREDWPVSGTTGYEFLNDLSGLLVNGDGVRRLQEAYGSLTEVNEKARDIIYQGKLAILNDSMSSELAMVTSQLYRLAKENRSTRDFTLPALQRALREVIACFPVYRTYVPSYGWEVTAEDHRRVREAIRWAKRRNRTMAWSMLDYIAAVLLLEFPSNLPEPLKVQWRSFANRFQQVTGPVTAKGVEDTSFYRYFPVASLNEVGGELGSEGHTPQSMHVKMQSRVTAWPHALSATGTHDTKRGEDVRARLHVLSEIPERWSEQVKRLHESTCSLLKEVDGDSVPTKNERYLLYQTLIGTWPYDTSAVDAWHIYRERMAEYFKKALREAKQHTSWLNPSESYEAAIDSFLETFLKSPQSPGLRGIDAITREIAGPGFVNSIAQVVLKSTLPGVPDFFQGSEFWDFRLVDPDNRRPVDFEHRQRSLALLREQFNRAPGDLLDRLHQAWDEQLKMFVMWRALQARSAFPSLFALGDYNPIEFKGPLAPNLFGFVRKCDSHWACVIVPLMPRAFAESVGLNELQMMKPHSYCGEVWQETKAILPKQSPTRWSDLMGGCEFERQGQCLAMESVYAKSFVTVLIGKALEGNTL